MSKLQGFDPSAAARPGSGVFGLPCGREASAVVLMPVPFDATTSYRPGTAQGPSAVLAASAQVDLFDRRFGRIYERGIYMLPESPEIRELNASASEAARPIVEAGGAEEGSHAEELELVRRACERVESLVHDHTARALREGKVPGLVGGEHSVPLGAIRAAVEAHPGLGILHIDAHMDLRDAFEGFQYSHASIMHNVLTKLPGVAKLVQVGIRDFSEDELSFARSHGARVETHFDDVWAEQMLDGAGFSHLCQQAVNTLPKDVYVSFDIDALDPSLCPHTGTPVPGGLSFNQAAILLDTLRKSGRRVVAFDLVEVAPGHDEGPETDANVGARVLYKLCGISGVRG